MMDPMFVKTLERMVSMEMAKPGTNSTADVIAELIAMTARVMASSTPPGSARAAIVLAACVDQLESLFTDMRNKMDGK